MSQTVVAVREIILITTTSPRGKGRCLDAREQDLVHAQLLELFQMMWPHSCDHFALQNKALEMKSWYKTIGQCFGVCVGL